MDQRMRHAWSVRGFILCLMVFALPTMAAMTVEQTWNAEYAELTGQIDRLKKSKTDWRNRLKAEALDQQALVRGSDSDPLDVVLRRTTALMEYFKDRKALSPSALGRFETRLSKLSAAAQSASKPDARKRLFAQTCALRRSIAFANPLLDFDDIVCMLKQPGDRRIVEQARAVCAGHSKGGGPVILKDFKSGAAPAEALTGVRITRGPWKGKQLVGKFSGLELNYTAPD